MKTCSRCNQDFLIEEFKVVNKRIGKIASMCNECTRKYNRDYWAKVKHIKGSLKNERTRLKRLEIRQYILKVLKENQCMDCGISDWRVLEFDHKDRKTKKINVADSTNYSLNVAKIEIAKCDIVCANCHNVRTIKQRNYYSGLI